MPDPNATPFVERDPDKIGVWIPSWIGDELGPTPGCLMLTQLLFLIQPNLAGHQRAHAPLVEDGETTWIARTYGDWGDCYLNRAAAMRAAKTLEEAGHLLRSAGSYLGHKVTLFAPNPESPLIVRFRTIRPAQSRESARPKVRKRASQGTDPDFDASLTGTVSNQLHEHARPPDPFDEFWSVYPRKADKGHAESAWAKALKKASAVDIIKGAVRYRDDPHRHPSYTAHAATWLNGQRWEDEPLRGPSTNQGNRPGAGTSDLSGIEEYRRQRGLPV